MVVSRQVEVCKHVRRPGNPCRYRGLPEPGVSQYSAFQEEWQIINFGDITC